MRRLAIVLIYVVLFSALAWCVLEVWSACHLRLIDPSTLPDYRPKL